MQNHPFLEDGVRIPAEDDWVRNQVDCIINRCKEVTKCNDLEVVLSGRINFRHYIAKQEIYKGNRDRTKKPHHWQTVRNHLMFDYFSYMTVFGMEADDYMAMHRFKNDTSVCICSRDKDLDTVPGWRYRWSCGERQPEVLPYFITPFQADMKFFIQMLIGDSVDNIMGCGIRHEKMVGDRIRRVRKGIGPKTALKLFEEAKTVQDLFDITKQEYMKMFKDGYENVMLENARLLYMGQSQYRLFEWDWLNYELEETDDTPDRID